MSERKERRERPEASTPLEQHLRKQFEPWTDFARQLIGRCRESMSRGVDVVRSDVFDNWCAEFEQLGAVEQERLVVLRLLFRRGLLKLENRQVHLNPSLEWSKDHEKDVIIEAIKLRPLQEVDIPTAVDVTHLCQRELQHQPVVPLRQLSKARAVDGATLVHALSLLDVAGAVSFDVGAEQPSVSAGPALSQNDRSLELLLFTVLALHHGQHVQGITEGWRRLLLSRAFIEKTLNTAYRNDSRKPDLRGYAGPGYLTSAMPVNPGRAPHSYFFSVNPQDGRRFLSSPQYEHWLSLHRHGESAVRTGVQQAWDHARAVEGIPSNIRLISSYDLEQVLLNHDSSLYLASRYGYVCPAGDRDDTVVFRKRGDRGKQARHYFIARRHSELQAWEQSQEYTTWREQRRLLPELLREWSAAITETLPPIASFIDEQYQPAYVVERQVITEAAGGLFTIPHLGQLGHIAAAQRMVLERAKEGKHEYFLFWPDAAKGRGYKDALLHRLQKQGKAQEHNNHQLFHWRVQQLARVAEWPEQPLELPAPPWHGVRFISYKDLSRLLRGLEPLSVSGLVRRGYLLHAQSSTTRRGVGYFIFCPNGAEQAKEVHQSQWYGNVQQIQRTRGFANLVRATRTPRS